MLILSITYWLILIAVLITILIFATSFIHTIILKVPYLPSKKRNIDKMLSAIKIEPNANIIDLGCGDGAILFRLEKKYNISGTGYEISLFPYILSILKKFIFKSKNKFIFTNLFKADISNTDIIFIYLTPRVTEFLSKKINSEAKKNCIIISNTFTIPNLQLINTISIPNSNQKIFVYKPISKTT